MQKILLVTGPTATGKTQLGVDLARQFNGEIISADSQQVYQGDDLLTGKDKDLYGEIPVWGLDLAAPEGSFSVAEFVRFATEKISEIIGQGRLPIVVGGTGHYLRALLDPFATIDIPPDPVLRSQNLPVAKLQKMVKVPMNPSDFQNPRRLIRAIEIGRYPKTKPKPKYDTLVLGLTAPKEILAQRVAQRRKSQPDLIKKEQALIKKQLLYQKKFLPAIWFDITDPAFHNRVWKLVANFVPRPTDKRRNTPTT